MNGIEQLHPLNHSLYRRVQHLVSLRLSWEAIADDIGLVGPRRVMDLCEWVLEYKEPKKLPMVAADARPAPAVWSKNRDTADEARRFMIWRRQRTGARRTLEAAGL